MIKQNEIFYSFLYMITIPIHIQNHIKRLYIIYSQELSNIKDFTNLKERRLKRFTTILKIYYPWACKQELTCMTDLIGEDDTKLEEIVWVGNITRQYKQDIIELFGVFDKNNSCSIDIDEFKDIFTSCSDIDDEQREQLFIDADTDKNGSLNIIEFIKFVSKHDELRQHFDIIIKKALNKRKKTYRDRLSILFNNLPNSPQRINWRPSLVDLKSPTKIKKFLNAQKLPTP